MQPGHVCPRCGQLLADGRCPSCAVRGAQLAAASPAPTGKSKAQIATFFVSVYLLLSGLVFFLSYSVIRHRQVRNYASRHHSGPVARPDELKGSGRIYLVQLGDRKAPYLLDDLAQWLKAKYSLDVRILPATPIDPSAWNPARKQYAAESLNEQLKHDHADLAADPDAYLIGFTDFDMYTTRTHWQSTFTQRDGRRTAIISSSGMQDSPFQIKFENSGIARQHFQARMRRILLKDVALIFWHLPVNRDVTSLLHDTLDPDLPAEDIYESDVDPVRSSRGEQTSEPCVYFDYAADHAIKLRPGPFIRACSDPNEIDEDTSSEAFEVYLRLGLLIDRRTDFFLFDSIPIKFQRATRDGWKGVGPFGMSGSDNYDAFLASRDNITISMTRADGGGLQLVRQPRGVSNLSLVKYVDVSDPGFYEMRWRPDPYEHYDVRRFDGAILTFLPCDNKVWCYLTDFHDFAGRELKFVRGENRRLERLVSPNQSWLQIDYDGAGQIDRITDNRNRIVHYSYNSAHQLTSVTYPSGERCLYTYDTTQHLLTFSASPDAHVPPRVLIRNEYSNGLLVKQSLEDGSTYSYRYDPEVQGSIQSVTARTADGRQFRLTIASNSTTVHEQ